jgi:pimeloyl-ACP methyl ester carboxylesterase
MTPTRTSLVPCAAWALVLALSCSSTDRTTTRRALAADGGPAADGGDAGPSGNEAGALPGVSIVKVPANGFVFDVRVAGPESAPAAILLHGFPETSYEWRHQLTALSAAGYRVIAPDQRGYSPGARPTQVSDYGVVLLAQDVLAIADALGVKRFHLVGHDWGGGVAWALGKLAAARLLSLTVLSTPHPDALVHELSDHSSCQFQDSSYFDLFTRPDAGGVFVANDDTGLRAVYTGLPLDAVDAYVSALGEPDALAAALDWYRANITNRQFDVPSLGEVTVPTQLLWGDQDPFFCRATVDLSAQFVTGPYRLVVLPGIGHWVAETAVEDVNARLLDEFGRYAGD